MRVSRKLIVFLTLTFGALSLFAQSACKTCGDIRTLEQTFLRLNILVDSDRENGVALMPSAYARFAKAEPREAGAEGKYEFEALVRLAAASLPFDEESIVADEVANALKRQPSFAPVYEAALKKYGDSCRAELLKGLVAERSCLNKAVESGTYEREGDKDRPGAGCRPATFDYENCVKKSSKSTRPGK